MAAAALEGKCGGMSKRSPWEDVTKGWLRPCEGCPGLLLRKEKKLGLGDTWRGRCLQYSLGFFGGD
jgi:hypothetical protein